MELTEMLTAALQDARDGIFDQSQIDILVAAAVAGELTREDANRLLKLKKLHDAQGGA